MISLHKSESDTRCQRVLFLSMDSLAVYHWQNSKSMWPLYFDVTADGMRHFSRYLQNTPRFTTQLLVDIVQEEYRQDSIPHVSERDRQAIIFRKRQQFFGNTPYFHAERQGREENGRRDDIMLYTAFTNPDQIQPWVKLLMENRIPLAGICSLPQLTGFLLDHLPGDQHQKLVLSMQSVSGFRMSFYLNGKLKVSRLVDVPFRNPEICITRIKTETETMLRYLNTMHLSDPDQPQSLCFMTGTPVIQNLQKLTINTSMLHHYFVDVSKLVEQLGLHAKIAVPFCDQLFAYILFTRTIPNYYATRNEMNFYRKRYIDRIIHTSGTGMICACLLWGSMNYIDGIVYRQQIVTKTQKADYFEALDKLAREKIPDMEVAPGDLRTLNDIGNALQQGGNTSFEILHLISKTMSQYPLIQLEQIEWNTSANLSANASVGESELQLLTKTGETIIENNKRQHYQVATLYGYIDSFTGDFRSALDMIGAFTEMLKSQRYVDNVTILSLPLNIGPETSLEGSSVAIPDQARFSIRIEFSMSDEN